MSAPTLLTEPPNAAASPMPTTPRLTLLFIGGAIVLLTAWVYLPVRGHDFIAFDDAEYVAENRVVQAGLSLAGVTWAFTTGHAGNWHPLTWLSHMVDAELFGVGAAGPHVMNAVIHVSNAVLLFALLRALTGATWRSGAVAALFALHPLRVESVAWISERKDVLSALFFLLTVWAYARYAGVAAGVPACRKDSAQVGRQGRLPLRLSWYVGALAFFACGLMCKPMLVTVPFVLLLLDRWPLRRPESWTRLLGEKIPFLLLTVASCAVTFLVQSRGGAVGSLGVFSVGERVANAAVACARYLGKIVWPVDLAVFYPHPAQWPAVTIGVSALVLAAIAVAIVCAARKAPAVAVGALWFFGMLVPTLGLVQVGLQSMADRYTYLPSIGLFVAGVWAGHAALRGRATGRVAAVACLALALAACTWRAREQVQLWRNTETLFGHALQVTQGNFVAHNSLAVALREQGRLREAREHLERALAIWPHFADAHDNLGHLLLQDGQTDAAIAHFRRAIESRPGFALAHYNLGTTLMETGRIGEALVQLERAAELQPEDALTHLNLGNAYLQHGKSTEALACYAKTLALEPQQADAHNNSGQAWLQQGRVAEAIRSFESALALQSDHANAHYGLAEIYLRTGRADEAIRHFQKTLSVAPNDADAHENLALALSQKGRASEAAEHRNTAARLRNTAAIR